MNFREVLKKQMEEKKLTAQDIAENVGCSKSYIYDLLKGARRFNEEIEDKICDYLGLTKMYVSN